jgi:monovalent cation:H+ antiporter-2, CPA2 family
MSKKGSRELFTLTVLVIALGIAVGSAKLFGVSMALGAFLAGMVVGRSEFSLRAATEALPMRDAFAVLFFVSVGMLFDPKHLVAEPGMVLLTLAVVLIGKPMAAFAIVWVMRYPPRVALAVAVALGQIGEFSFILGTMGQDLKILSPAANHSLIAAALVSITLNPLLYRAVGPLEAWAVRHPRLWKLLCIRSQHLDKNTAALDEAFDESIHKAVIIGYGPVGQTVARLLKEHEIQPTVIEMNLETVRRIRSEGLAAVYGDAKHQDTLVKAGIEQSNSLILSTAGQSGGEEIVRLARELNPKIHVLARTVYVREMDQLRKAGADAVYSGEGEVGLAFTLEILRELGASADQVERERERVYRELFG